MSGLAPMAASVVTAHSIGVSPAFYVAVGLYGLATLLIAAGLASPRPKLGRVARLCLLLAFVAHGVEIGWRGVDDMHPGSSVHEALGFMAWLMVGAYLLATLRHSLLIAGAVVTPLALVILATARLSPAGEALSGLTLLGRIHISLAALGVAIFALATALAVIYLLEDRNLKAKRFNRLLFRRGIALDSLDRLAHRLVLVGFPIFSVAILLGVIWVSQRSSGYDRPEYPLALITWLSYAGLLVTRTTHGWRGRKAAALTIVGFTASLLVFAIYFARRALL